MASDRNEPNAVQDRALRNPPHQKGGLGVDNSDILAQLALAVKTFNHRRNWEPSAKDLAMSIAIEAAELMEHFQWGLESSWGPEAYDAIRLEVADVMIYLLHFCRTMQIDLADAVMDKLAINESRFPVSAAHDLNHPRSPS